MKNFFFKTRYAILIIGVVLFASTRCNSQETIHNSSFTSSVLQKNVSFSICLPSNYVHSNQDYPVIFLLHGADGEGTDWIKRAHIDHTADSLEASGILSPVILVMADAWNSYYINNFNNSVRYEDFFVKEFVPFIDSVYRVKPGRKNHILMGLSMGGYGAVILGIKHADLFGSVIAMSAAVRNDSMMKHLSNARYSIYFTKVYGPALMPESRITSHWKENSPYYLVDRSSAPGLKNTNWYFECGSKDPLLPASLALHKLFNKYHIPHTLVIRKGTHNWNFWRKGTIHGLVYLATLR